MIREWFTAAELAGLPDMPASESGVIRRAKRDEWAARKRQQGKGLEYHLSGLPTAAQTALLVRAARADTQDQRPRPRAKGLGYDREAVWARFDALTDAQRRRAEAKLAAIQAAVMLNERSGVALREALKHAAEGTPWSAATLRDIYYGKPGRPGLVEFERHDWLAALAPRHQGRTAVAECSPEAWEAFKADYLRLEGPALEACFRRLQRLACARGWQVPQTVKPLKRRLERELNPNCIVLAREGADALARRYPPQQRSRAVLRALEAVNADGHRFDVFVRWPDGTIARPMMVAWQDILSAKVLSWRVDQTESADGYRLSFSDLLRAYGIPSHVYVDNGRGIASKLMTGGTPNRYRFKVRADEPVGLLTQLVGPEGIHWTTPYHGQAKPIERSFRDMCEDIAKDPRLAGAYTGNKPDAKPQNYGSRAVALDEFLRVLDDGIRAHNARRGRRGIGMDGRSFDEVFGASYQRYAEQIPRPTESQLCRWLLAADSITAEKQTGAVRLLETRYWSEALAALAGRPAAERQVVVYFDPDNLSRPVHVHTPDGRLIGVAAPMGAVAFNDTQAARDTARDRTRFKRAAREQLDAQRRMDARAYGRLLDETTAGDDAAPDMPEQKVVRGAFQPDRRRVAGSDLVDPDAEAAECDARLGRAIGPMLRRMREESV
jgi:putative transposase